MLGKLSYLSSSRRANRGASERWLYDLELATLSSLGSSPPVQTQLRAASNSDHRIQGTYQVYGVLHIKITRIHFKFAEYMYAWRGSSKLVTVGA